MRVFITGATGLVGKRLTHALQLRGDQVLALSRSASRAQEVLGAQVEPIEGNPRYEGPWMKTAAGCDAIINLAGEPVLGQRWNDDVKREILESRVHSTRNITKAIQVSKPPKVFINASAVGYYGSVKWPREVDESHPPGSDFLAKVCVDWEAAADIGAAGKTRLAIVRVGVVLAADGGALAQMLPIFRCWLGGPVATGRQAFPWVHIDDLVRMFLWILDTPSASGVFNGTAPDAVTNKEFSTTLGNVLHRPAFLPVPAFALRMMFGDGAEFLITGQRVIPAHALELGFAFRHPDLPGALRNLLG